MDSFNHLRVYSEYSIGTGIIRIKELIQKAKKMGVSAIAISDINNIFAAVEFYKEAINAKIKPIIASEISFKYPDDEKIYHAVLYCQNVEGYQNLSMILSEIYQSLIRNPDQLNKTGKPFIESDYLFRHTNGLIVLNGGINSDLNTTKEVQKKRIELWQNKFQDRFYLEVPSPIGEFNKNWLIKGLELAYEYQIPAVATHPTYFLNAEDFIALEIRASIDQKVLLKSNERVKIASSEQYFINQKQFFSLFKNCDKNLFINTDLIAKRCNFNFVFNQYLSPKYETKDQSEDEVLTEKSIQGLIAKVGGTHLQEEKMQIYRDRLDKELQIIKKMKFSGYFLVVADYVNWAIKNDILVAPGRGSGAGSLVAYALNITKVDPIEHNLIFERFLNPERISMPDFDIDFCAHQRGRVFEYIRSKYEKQIPVQIITFGSMNAKAVVRDVARVLSYPYGLGDRIAREIVGNFKLSDLIGDQNQVLKERLEKAKLDMQDEEDPFVTVKSEEEIRKEVQAFFVNAAKFQELYHQDEEVRDVVDNAIKLEGLIRNVGTHAGGLIIAPEDIRKFCPVYTDPDKPNQLLSQFHMGSAEAIGLIKFDLLGVTSLSVIKNTCDMVQKLKGRKIELEKIKFNNKRVFSLLRKGLTSGIFQLESPGMKKMLKGMQIENFDELVLAIALFRPGPLGSKMDQEFIDLKRKVKREEYEVEELKEILGDTRGLLIYQEQVMKIAQVICGYSLAKADELRKAMGKKDADIMGRQKEEFFKGGLKNKYDRGVIEALFNKIVRFAEYGFNKSHSVAYAIISYYTAYLKTVYPDIFFACEMSEHFNDSKGLHSLALEIKQFNKVSLRLPNINHSEYLFKPVGDGSIEYALGAIKGVGKKAAEEIALQREKKGDFRDFEDFCLRVDLSVVNKRTIDSLIYSGAMDQLPPFERKVKSENLVALMQAANQYKKSRELGMNSLFDSSFSNLQFKFLKEKFNKNHEYTPFEKLNHQLNVFGYYQSETLLDCYNIKFGHLNNLISIESLIQNRYLKERIGQFYVVGQLDYFAQEVQQTNVIGLIRLSNSIEKNFELRCSLEKFNQYQELLKNNKVIVCNIEIDTNYQTKLIEIYSLAEFRTRELDFVIDFSSVEQNFIMQALVKLKKWFKEPKHCGDATLLAKINTLQYQCLVDFGEHYRFYPLDKYLDELQYQTDFLLQSKAKTKAKKPLV